MKIPTGTGCGASRRTGPSQRDAPWDRGDPAAPMATPELLRDTAEEAPPEQLALLSHHRWGGQNPTSTQNAPNPCAGQGPLLDAAPSWPQCHSHRVTASTECWGQGLTPSQHPVPPQPHRGLCGAMLYSLGGTPVSPPSPEGVPELHRNGAHLLGFAVALHRRPSLAAEGAARPESEDGKELQEGSSGRGVHRTLGTPPDPTAGRVSPWR